MKNVNVVVANAIQVKSNGAKVGPKWARLIDKQTGKVHTGSVKYIKRLALAKYNALASL